LRLPAEVRLQVSGRVAPAFFRVRSPLGAVPPGVALASRQCYRFVPLPLAAPKDAAD